MKSGNYKPSAKEIQHIRNLNIPDNTRKSVDKWELEQEMIEFICGVRQINSGEEYAPLSLCNEINCLATYFMDQPLNINKYNLGSKQEFRELWKTLDGKMKQLKKIGKITCHHDPLVNSEVHTIFNHEATSTSYSQGLQYCVFMWCCLLFASRGGKHAEMRVLQFVFTQDGGLHFTKFSQKNDQDGINGNLDSLIIPVPPDSKGLLGPVHDIKLYIEHQPKNFKSIIRGEWYLDSKLGSKTCANLMKSICNASAGVPITTSMAITGHKSESSFRIYSRPSDKQKEEALSLLIETAGDLPSIEKFSKNSNELPSSQEFSSVSQPGSTSKSNNSSDSSDFYVA
ncbi:16649_t:CDS:2 [Acaulospora morrowiae]|uniref:16649_t:CDS:1 n=1 Tax=Acaulospora morrowiae TaxID=94023 RepID=A0A9N8VBV5_9GLOM|nr:16649_t:CDS:2 [Acaulospora morrowiae]